MKKILIIDDEIAVSQVFETALSGAGYTVKIAVDGKSGLETARNEQFNLILCDEMMPDMNGNEVLKALKADPQTNPIKVAMLTNFKHDEMVKEALMTGAEDYILKYETLPDQLLEKVKGIIGDPYTI